MRSRTNFPVVLNEERHFFARLEVWAARIASIDEARLVTEQEIRERRAGVVRADTVVIARNKTAAVRAVLVIALGAVVAAAVVSAVLPHAIIAAKLER